MTCPVIVQVFFDGCEDTDPIVPSSRYDKHKPAHYLNMPYWQAPDEKGAVYRWSFDMVTCSDERWVVFGPFVSLETAVRCVNAAFPPHWLRGYRVINEHCAAHCGALGRVDTSKTMRTFEFYREAWTDG